MGRKGFQVDRIRHQPSLQQRQNGANLRGHPIADSGERMQRMEEGKSSRHGGLLTRPGARCSVLEVSLEQAAGSGGHVTLFNGFCLGRLKLRANISFALRCAPGSSRWDPAPAS